jgi:uncharacterized membrane protein
MANEQQWRCRTEPESRRPIFAATLFIIAGQTWVAHSLALRPTWVFPAVATALLVASIAVYEVSASPGMPARVLSYIFVTVLVVANAASLVLLVHGVFVGSTLGPLGLLTSGLALWVATVAVFALMYWEVDGGGLESRAAGYEGRYPDLVFPQQQADQQGLAPETWKPSFYDYLYVSLTSAIAFSPTDTMPYSLRAKLIMGAENVLCFATLAVLVARAVNIAHG